MPVALKDYSPANVVETNCACCGVSFSHGIWFKRQYCSKSCSAKHRRATGSLPNKPHTGMSVACSNCKSEIYRPRAELGKANYFCSSKCRGEWQSDKQIVECERCGSAVSLSPSQAKPRRFCSWECYGASKFVNLAGFDFNGKPARINDQGYVLVWCPERKKPWALHHRVVVESNLGRPISAEEHVHHINGDKTDNRIENLQVIDNAAHGKITATRIWESVRSVESELEAYRALYGPLPIQKFTTQQSQSN